MIMQSIGSGSCVSNGLVEWEDYTYLDDDGEIPLPLPTEDDIKALETTLNMKFPEDFREELKAHQGQSPVQCVASNKATVRCLYHSFQDGQRAPFYSIADAWNRQIEAGYDPKIVPFSDCGNSYFCLDYRNSGSAPSVTFVIGDYEPGDAEAYVPLAATFTEFLGQLQE